MEVRYPPPPWHKRGILAILARYHMKTRQNWCDTPFAILSRKDSTRYGGVSFAGPLRASMCPCRGAVPSVREEKKHAFGKPCLCLCDTRHIRHFCCFHGVRGAKPSFCWVSVQIRHLSCLHQKPFFFGGAGDKNKVYSEHGFCDLG